MKREHDHGSWLKEWISVWGDQMANICNGRRLEKREIQRERALEICIGFSLYLWLYTKLFMKLHEWKCVCSVAHTTPWQVLLSMGFPKEGYWSRFPFPFPGDILDPGIEPMSLASPALAGRFFTTEPPGGKCTVRGKYPRNCKVENYQSDFLWVNIKRSYWKHGTCNGDSNRIISSCLSSGAKIAL